jgi:hypothetical protein
MDLIKQLQLTNYLRVIKMRNEQYLDKVKDKTINTFKELTDSNNRLDDCLLNFHEQQLENQMLKSRNRDLESLTASYKLWSRDLIKENNQLKNQIRLSDNSIFDADEHGL